MESKIDFRDKDKYRNTSGKPNWDKISELIEDFINISASLSPSFALSNRSKRVLLNHPR